MRLKEYPIDDYVRKCQTWNPKSSGVGSFDYIDLSSVDKDTKSIVSIERYECSDAPSRARQLVETDDVLVATVRPNLNGVALVNGAHHGITASTGYCVLRPDQDKLDSRFLFHWVKTGAFVQRMVDVATGANYPAVSDAKVKTSKIPLPPLADQRRIAGILDAADALRAKRREVLAQLDTLLRSTFLDMFGDPVVNPMGLRRETLESAFQFTTGKLDSNAAVEGGKYPFFTCARETSAIDDYAFDCEALLLAGNNANADYSVKHYKGRFNAYQRTYVITIKESALIYAYARLVLAYLLGDLKRFSKGTNTKYLTLVILNRMPILVPPLDLQRRFAAVVESIEKQKARQRAHLAELDTLFASLQSRAFRGDL